MMALLHRIGASLPLTVAVVTLLGALGIWLGVVLAGMRITGALGLYFVIWWIMLFAVLPVGVRSQAEASEVTAGTEPGAPTLPMLREKAILTTIVADVVFLTAGLLLPVAGL